MDLIGLISGASSNLLDKVGDFSTAVDDLYKASPLGKLEDTFTNSAIHKAFEGDPNAIFGGGGQGGYAVAAAASFAPPTIAGSVGVSLGGEGGDGGTGGTVKVYEDANITTTGESSTGLIAQSVGGGGGTG